MSTRSSRRRPSAVASSLLALLTASATQARDGLRFIEAERHPKESAARAGLLARNLSFERLEAHSFCKYGQVAHDP
jgi:hypothetical protein